MKGGWNVLDIQYILALQNLREAMGGVLNEFFVQISDLSYGIFIWMLACILFWGVDKKGGRFLFLNIGFSRIGMALTFAELILFIVIYPLCFSKIESMANNRQAKLQANKA